VGQGLLIHEVSRSHSTTHHSRYDSSGRVISSSQHTTLTTDIHGTGEIGTHNLNRRAAADLRLRPRGHWDRLQTLMVTINFPFTYEHIYVCNKLHRFLSLVISFQKPQCICPNHSFYKQIPSNLTHFAISHDSIALQTGRLRVRFPIASMGFFNCSILPAALWQWGRLII
jgi:hypothetical protein